MTLLCVCVKYGNKKKTQIESETRKEDVKEESNHHVISDVKHLLSLSCGGEVLHHVRQELQHLYQHHPTLQQVGGVRVEWGGVSL